MTRTKRNKTWGYTVIEVMMAMSILSIGATGIVALQKATVIGNTQARDLATATAISSEWLERLRTDALRWKKLQTGGDTMASTYYIQIVDTASAGTWQQPTLGAFPGAPTADNVWAESDVRGMDSDPANNDTAFCTNIRLTRLGTPNSTPPSLMEDVVRAEVRVFWLRTHGTNVTDATAGTINGDALCDETTGYINALDTATAVSRYHFVYATTALIRNDNTQ